MSFLSQWMSSWHYFFSVRLYQWSFEKQKENTVFITYEIILLILFLFFSSVKLFIVSIHTYSFMFNMVIHVRDSHMYILCYSFSSDPSPGYVLFLRLYLLNVHTYDFCILWNTLILLKTTLTPCTCAISCAGCFPCMQL